MAIVRELDKVDGKRYMTVDEAASFLGLKPTAIRNYLSADKIPTYKFKTLTLLSTDDVEAWRERQRG